MYRGYVGICWVSGLEVRLQGVGFRLWLLGSRLKPPRSKDPTPHATTEDHSANATT